MNESPRAAPPAPASGTREAVRHESVVRLTSAGLFAGRREIEIEHAGRIYRLRITQNDKLILTA